ncbi:MAG: DUF4388 domain-containing protein [Planctomycetota bacterium]|nr:MAG: DUF4388 domain-containing protein [Planctomycetota bacterium]
MPLVGNTKAYDLSSVLQFLSDNRYSGTLFFIPKETKQQEIFYLIEGNLKIPFNAEGKPVLDMEGLDEPPKMEFASDEEKQDFYRKTRLRLEEEMYEKFFHEARYRFERDLVPEPIRSGEFPSMTLPTGSILMEAARRIDDLNRIQEKYPASGVLFEFTGEIKDSDRPHILELMDGSRDMHQLAMDAQESLYNVCLQVASLMEEERARILQPDQYLDRLKELVENRRLTSALRLFSQILSQKDIMRREEGASILFKEENWTSLEDLKGFQGKMKGEDFSFYFKYLVRLNIPVVFHIRFEDKIFDIEILDNAVKIYEHGVDHGLSTLLSLMAKTPIPPHVMKCLRESAPFSVDDIYNVAMGAGVELNLKWETFLANRVVDVIAPLYNQTLQIEVLSVEDFSPPGEVPFECTFENPESWGLLEMIIDQWISVRDDAPPDKAIFTTSKKAKELIENKPDDPMAKFLILFRRNRRTLAELHETVKEQIGASEFYFKTVAQIAALNLRPLEQEECKQLVRTALVEEDFKRALNIISSAEAMGYDDPYFKITREDIRLRTKGAEEGDRLVGDLKSFSLAEVLQNLVTNQQTGTLRITSSHANQEIYFYRGEVSLLKIDDVADEETLATFVSDSSLEGLDLFGQQEEISEEEMLEELAAHAQEQIYEIFLWDDAQFIFILDALPPEFFEESDHITKLNLNTMSFLMGAVNRLEEWAEISQIIPSEQAIFKFITPEYKQMAMASGIDVQLLYLIDGSHNIDDLIRITGKGKFEVCSILYDLYHSGYITSLDVNELIQRGKEAYERRDYGLSRKFYSYAALLNPADPRIRKIVDGLTKRIGAQKRHG